MSAPGSLSETDQEQRIVILVQSLREIEQELQSLTGGQVDTVAGPEGSHIFLQEAQKKLLQSENRYRSLAKATAQIVWTTDANGLVSGELPEWQAFTGQSTEEILGYGCQQAIHPEDQKRTSEIWTQAVASESSYDLEYRLRRQDGVYRDFAVRGVPVHAGDGSISEWVGCCTDITDQKEAQQELARNQSLLRMASRISRLGAWQCDVPALNVIWSDETAAIHDVVAGYSPTVSTAIDYYVPAYREKIAQAFQLCIHEGTSFDLEAQIDTANGRRVWVRAMGEAVRDEHGKVTQVQGALQDIDSMKRAEEALSQKDTLIRMAGQLTRTGGWFVNTLNQQAFWSDEVCDILQFPHGTAPALPDALALHPPQSRVIITAAMTACSTVGTPFDVEIEIDNAKGERIWARVCGEPERAADNTIPRVWGAFQDITQRKQADEKIKSQLHELERWREATLDREDRVRSLKKEVNLALGELGKPLTYIESTPETAEIITINHAPKKSEEARLATLRTYDILDSQGEKDFDDLVTLAAHICGTPLAFISLVDQNRQWFKASFGNDITETSRDVSFCAHAIGHSGLFVVPDASKDMRFSQNPLVTGDPGIRFYAGSPLVAPDGNALGTLCVIDRKPGQLTVVQARSLAVLSNHVMALIELRHQSREMTRSNAALLGILEDERASKTTIIKSEEQIAEQASFLDKAQDAIVVRDLEGDILFWNKGAERMYGWLRQDVLGLNMDAAIYSEPKTIEEINRQVISKGEWNGELQHFTKDRTALVVEARMTLIRDPQGNPKSVLAIKTDITEKKKIEAQFMRAQRMESIGTLAGGIAHDLNNILAPILMSIDLLKSQSDSPQTTKILQTIQTSAKRGADIVRQVLSFARGMEGERIEVQPKHLLNDLENIIKDTFPKDIRLRFSVPNDIWTILGDPTQVHQVLLNLSVNARDAMPNGGNLTISVENCVLDEQYAAMHSHAKPGRYVKIIVADSGMGIPPRLIEKIFEPFFTTKELSKGTGLGLSTVMAIVKSHAGVVNVYSDQGKGTSFTIYLPAMEMSAQALKEHLALSCMPRGNGETILVVDDEASILTITGQTLEAYGYHVLTAIDGADALAIYLQHRDNIAVVLTDMMMPVMDGPAMIHALMRVNPAVKIIAASGLNAQGEAEKATAGGLKHFLIKPYTAEVMLQTIRAILEGRDPSTKSGVLARIK